MKKPELTPWFPADVTPVHVGVYATQFCVDAPYSKWNGVHWMDSRPTIEGADRTKHIGAHRKSWRGLAADPKAKP